MNISSKKSKVDKVLAVLLKVFFHFLNFFWQRSDAEARRTGRSATVVYDKANYKTDVKTAHDTCHSEQSLVCVPRRVIANSTMDLLPLECIEALLLYLMPEDIGSFSLVSRWWLDMTKDEILWKTVFVRAFGTDKNSDSTWRLACAQSFASLHSVLKTGETTLRSSPSRYRKITDFILGGNYTQEEVQGVCNLSTLPAIVTHVARAGHFAVLKRLARHIPLKIFKGFLPQAFLKSSEGKRFEFLATLLF